MSRLYGRSFDVYGICKELVSCNIKPFKKDIRKTDWESLQKSPDKIELYLSEDAIKLIEANPITIAANPLYLKEKSQFASETKQAIWFLPRFTPIEEYKREFVFFLGNIISLYSPDLLPNDEEIPCEYGDLLAVLFEYLYLKETNQEEKFLDKHLEELLFNAKHFIELFNSYEKTKDLENEARFATMTEKQSKKCDEFFSKQHIRFLEGTQNALIPMSSVDGVLQIIDRGYSKEEYKELIDKLINNENQNRQALLNEMGINSFGYKRLRKEIEKRG